MGVRVAAVPPLAEGILAKHLIKFDLVGARVLIIAWDFWNDAELSQFQGEIDDVFGRVGRTGKDVAMLVDLSDFRVQASKTVERDNFLGSVAKLKLDKHAVVATGAINRMQLRRLYAGVPTEFFDAREAAAEWLGWSPSDPILNIDRSLPNV